MISLYNLIKTNCESVNFRSEFSKKSSAKLASLIVKPKGERLKRLKSVEKIWFFIWKNIMQIFIRGHKHRHILSQWITMQFKQHRVLRSIKLIIKRLFQQISQLWSSRGLIDYQTSCSSPLLIERIQISIDSKCLRCSVLDSPTHILYALYQWPASSLVRMHQGVETRDI